MGQMSYATLQPDPVLTQLVLEFGIGQGWVWPQVLPFRQVANRTFRYAKWSFSDKLRTNVDTRRSIGDSANENITPSITWHTSMTQPYGLKERITDEDRRDFPMPEQLVRAKLEAMSLALQRQIEITVRDFCQDTATVAYATPSVKWDAASAVVIEANIDAARTAFVKQCGKEANRIIIPTTVAKVMKRDSTIRDLVKYTDPTLLVGGDLPPTIWGLQTIIPGVLRDSGAPGAAASVDFIWTSDKVTLAYVDMSAANNPSAFTPLMGFFTPGALDTQFQATTWRDPDPTRKTDWYAVDCEYDIEETSALGLYILNDVLT